MTAGEMAKWFNVAGRIDAALTVIPVRGWRRSWWPSEHGLGLPRLREGTPSAEQLMLASSVGLLEATNLTWALGPSRRSLIVGAPWLDARALAKALGDRLIPGVDFRAGRNAFAGQLSPALRVEVVARDNANGLRVVAAILAVIRHMHPDSLRIDTRRMTEMTASVSFGSALVAGEDSDAVVDRTLPLLVDFRRRARDAYIYR